MFVHQRTSVLNELFVQRGSCCFSLCDVVIFEQIKINKEHWTISYCYNSLQNISVTVKKKNRVACTFMNLSNTAEVLRLRLRQY